MIKTTKLSTVYLLDSFKQNSVLMDPVETHIIDIALRYLIELCVYIVLHPLYCMHCLWEVICQKWQNKDIQSIN